MRLVHASLLTLLFGCGGVPGPACQQFIREFERVCSAKDAPGAICSEEFRRQIAQAKRVKSTEEMEGICQENAEIFAQLKTRGPSPAR
jgi:hypothetical protein